MKAPGPKILRDLMMLRGALQHYHPLVIEGHTKDTRDASTVANRIVHNLQERWEIQNMTKPIILISQGDPLKERGISAITRNVAEGLGIKRCLVCLDTDIDPNHTVKADRHDVIYEIKYSQLLDILQEEHHDGEAILKKLEMAVDDELALKNEKRIKTGKGPLASWYKDYAMLQEVTKSAMKFVSGGDLTLAHTVESITEFSVTSFYSVGVDLGLVHADDILPYSEVNEQMEL